MTIVATAGIHDVTGSLEAMRAFLDTDGIRLLPAMSCDLAAPSTSRGPGADPGERPVEYVAIQLGHGGG